MQKNKTLDHFNDIVNKLSDNVLSLYLYLAINCVILNINVEYIYDDNDINLLEQTNETLIFIIKEKIVGDDVLPLYDINYFHLPTNELMINYIFKNGYNHRVIFEEKINEKDIIV
jgi:hypothetical protein